MACSRVRGLDGSVLKEDEDALELGMGRNDTTYDDALEAAALAVEGARRPVAAGKRPCG